MPIFIWFGLGFVFGGVAAAVRPEETREVLRLAERSGFEDWAYNAALGALPTSGAAPRRVR